MSSTSIVSFRDLEAWQAAMELAVAIYGLAAALPPVHRFELGSQLCRAATSVPSNVAEGHASKGTRVYMNHLRIALGSVAELDTLVELMLRSGLTTESKVTNLLPQIARTGQLLHGLRRALRRRLARTTASIVLPISLLVCMTGARWLGVL